MRDLKRSSSEVIKQTDHLPFTSLIIPFPPSQISSPSSSKLSRVGSEGSHIRVWNSGVPLGGLRAPKPLLRMLSAPEVAAPFRARGLASSSNESCAVEKIHPNGHMHLLFMTLLLMLLPPNQNLVYLSAVGRDMA